MNENEFEHDGKVYVAVDAEFACDGCAAQFSGRFCSVAKCCDDERSDGRDVIFVEKQP